MGAEARWGWAPIWYPILLSSTLPSIWYLILPMWYTIPIWYTIHLSGTPSPIWYPIQDRGIPTLTSHQSGILHSLIFDHIIPFYHSCFSFLKTKDHKQFAEGCPNVTLYSFVASRGKFLEISKLSWIFHLDLHLFLQNLHGFSCYFFKISLLHSTDNYRDNYFSVNFCSVTTSQRKSLFKPGWRESMRTQNLERKQWRNLR